MKERPTIDVSGLPSVVLGSRAPLWWGVVSLLAIEGTVFALLAATYSYLRGGESAWPPPGVAQPSLALVTVNLAILLVSALPMRLADKAAHREDVGRVRLWLLVATLLGAVFLVLRGVEISSLTYEWRSHAYGSIVWTILGLHTLHLLTTALENVLFLVLFAKGPVEDHHMLDVSVNVLYWYFVVAVWVPFFVILYLDPGLFVA